MWTKEARNDRELEKTVKWGAS